MMMVHGRAQRLFLQVMLERRSVDEVEAVNLMKSCCQEFKERVPQLDVFVRELNKEMEDVQLALRMALEEREDSDYPCLVLVNLMAGQATRMLSTFPPNELSFVRVLVGEIVASKEGEVPINAAINLGLHLQQKLKASVCEKLVERMVEDKWLLLTDYATSEACVSLSGLITAEINTYLEEIHADDILKCFFCTKLTFRGYRCVGCSVTVHRDCAKKYWDTRKKPNTCPGQNCSAFLGPASPKPRSKRSRVRLAKDGEASEAESQDEEEEEEEEEMEVENETDRSMLTRNGNRRGRSGVEESQYEEEEEEEEEMVVEKVRDTRSGRRGRVVVRSTEM